MTTKRSILAFFALILFALALLLHTPPADATLISQVEASISSELNATAAEVRQTMDSLKAQVLLLIARIENDTQALSDKIDANIQAVEDRVRTQFDVFVDDVKTLATGFIIAICASFGAVFIGNLAMDLLREYCKRRCYRAFSRVSAKPATGGKVTSGGASVVTTTNDERVSLLRKRGVA